MAGGRPNNREKIIDTADRKQLFIDDRLVKTSQGLDRTVNPPRKAGVVFEPLLDTEGSRASVSSILEANGEYWMYYTIYVPGDWGKKQWPEMPDWARLMMCLAISSDGIHWERKKIGIFDVGRGKDNAIIMPCALGTVFIDPQRTRGSKFWFCGQLAENPWWDESRGVVRIQKDKAGVYLCHSKDGIHWKVIREQMLPFWCDTQNQIFFDSRLGRYVGYVRGRKNSLRVVCRGESTDLDRVPWPFTDKGLRGGPIGSRPRGWWGLNHQEWPVVLEPDKQDPPQTDIYTPNVEIYPWAEDVYLAWLPLYRHYDGFDSHGRDHRGQYRNDGPVETQLAVGRDGIKWHRFHTPYVRLGRTDEVDGGTIYMGVGMLRQGDEIWQYYTGERSTHGNYEDHPDWSTAVIRLIQRLDGMVSLDAGPGGGELITPPITFTGDRLQLNIDCGGMGEAWVELQDKNGTPIEGYTFQDSVSIDRNGVAQETWWKGGPAVGKLAGKPIRIHIKMRSAKLYAFQFVKSGS